MAPSEVGAGRRGRCRLAGHLRPGATPEGEQAAKAYVPHTLSYPQPGWAEQDPREWLGAVAPALAEVHRAVNGASVRALSFGSQLDGLVATDADGAAGGPALIWMDRRARLNAMTRPSGSTRTASRAERMQPGSRPRGRQDRLAPRQRAPISTRAPAGFSCLARSSPGMHRRAGGRSLECLVVDAPGRPEPRLVAEACAAFRDRLRSRSLSGRRAPSSARCRRGCERPLGSIRGPRSSSAPATRWRRPWGRRGRPGVVCDVMGTAEPVCAVVPGPDARPRRRHELHPHAAPGGWLLENPGWLSGGAYRWFRDELGSVEAARGRGHGRRRLRASELLAEDAPGGRRRGVVGAGAERSDRPGVERRRAGRVVRARRGPRPRSSRASAAGGQRVRAARRAGGHPCRGPRADRARLRGGRRAGDLLRQIRADVTGLPVTRPDDVETTARGAAMLAAAGVGLHVDVPSAARVMASPRSEPLLPRAECREVYDQIYRRHRALYSALQPLFS